jgi:hypothetical protein
MTSASPFSRSLFSLAASAKYCRHDQEQEPSQSEGDGRTPVVALVCCAQWSCSANDAFFLRTRARNDVSSTHRGNTMVLLRRSGTSVP